MLPPMRPRPTIPSFIQFLRNTWIVPLSLAVDQFLSIDSILRLTVSLSLAGSCTTHIGSSHVDDSIACRENGVLTQIHDAPDAIAAFVPIGESSTITTSSGSTLRRSIASKYISGSGFGFVTESLPTISSSKTRTPNTSSTRLASSLNEDVATDTVLPSRFWSRRRSILCW